MIELGSIGWDDSDEIADFGDRDDPNGVTLINVQLFRGRDKTQPLTTRAQGHKIQVQMRDGIVDLPPKDALAYIAIPDGKEECSGIGLLIGSVSPGAERKRNVAPGNKFIQASEGAAGIGVNRNGAIVLHTTADNTAEGASIYLRLDTTKFEIRAPFGKFVFDASGIHMVTASGARFDLGAINIPGLSDLLPAEVLAAFTTYCTISAGRVQLDGGAVLLGAGDVHHPALPSPIEALPAPQAPLAPAAISSCIRSQTVYVAP